MLALQAKTKGVTLTSRVQRGLDEVVADQRAIQQILINLVGNAVKFTEAGGAISIDASMRDGVLNLASAIPASASRPTSWKCSASLSCRSRTSIARRFEGRARLVAGQGSGGAAWRRLRDRQHAGRRHDHHRFRSQRMAPACPAAGTARNDPVEFPPRLKAAPVPSVF